MKEKLEQLIKEAEAAFDGEVKEHKQGTPLAAKSIYLGSAISALKGARDNLNWREEAVVKEGHRSAMPLPVNSAIPLPVNEKPPKGGTPN